VGVANIVVPEAPEVEKECAWAGGSAEVGSAGRKTYRAPGGRPEWAKSADVELPVIDPAEKDGAIHKSGSVDRESVCAECKIARPAGLSMFTTADPDSGVSYIVVDPPDPPPTHEAQLTDGGVRIITIPDIASSGTSPAHFERLPDTPRPCRSPPTDIEQRLSEIRQKVREANSDQFGRVGNRPISKDGGASSVDSGSGRRKNEVRSTGRAKARDSGDKTAAERRRVLSEVNRKFGRASRDHSKLMTSSVTAVVTRRPRVRSSASLGADRMMTSPLLPEMETGRRLEMTKIRVRCEKKRVENQCILRYFTP